MELLSPFAKQACLASGVIKEPSNHWTRHLIEIGKIYQDQHALNKVLESDDPLIYEVYEILVPEEIGQLIQCTTIIHPGKVGREYYMTKGHYHNRRDRAEVYLCLSGHGYLLLQTKNGDSQAVEMGPGVSSYIPPHWAHRTVNVGDKPFVFYGVYPADAGHDYGTIEEMGFPLIVCEKGGASVIEKNPDFRLK